MKIRYYLLILLALPFVLTSCGDDDDAQPQSSDLQLHFYIQYADQPVVLLEPHDYARETDIYFSRFSFYLAEVTLLNGNDETEVLDIDLLNFTPDLETEQDALEGTAYVIENVPPGDYTGIRFGLGVPADQNALTPIDFDLDHPLANSGEYWSGWQSYIFHKTEGRADLEGDGTFETPIALHVGSDTCYREVTFNTPFSIEEGSAARLPYEIDLQSVLIQNNTPYDIAGTPQIHSLSQIDQAIEISDNLQISILERFE